jgi:predicted ester cyclase
MVRVAPVWRGFSRESAGTADRRAVARIWRITIPLQSSTQGAQIRSGYAYEAALPGYWISIDDMVAEGDKVVVRETVHGVHAGSLMHVAPTGRAGYARTVLDTSPSAPTGDRLI